jgi:hypothetical protein
MPAEIAQLSDADAARRALLSRIQPERFELARPFRRSIAQPRDVDAPRQAARDGSADSTRKKSEGAVWRPQSQ